MRVSAIMIRWMYVFLIFCGSFIVAEQQHLKLNEVDALQENDNLIAIERQIQSLQGELEDNRLSEMKKEVDSQGLMIADWKGYARDVEMLRRMEEREKNLEEEIGRLQAKRNQLLNSQKK